MDALAEGDPGAVHPAPEREPTMPSLADILLQPGKRPAIVSECETLLDEEVSSKGGLTGLAVKAAFKMVKAVKPGIVRESVDGLLDDFVRRMEPFYTQWSASGGSVGLAAYFIGRSGEIADALLGVTDERAARAKNATLRKAYESLRPQGRKHVQEAIPRVARMVERNQA